MRLTVLKVWIRDIYTPLQYRCMKCGVRGMHVCVRVTVCANMYTWHAPLYFPLFWFLTLSCLLSVGLSLAVLFPCVQHEPGDASETVTQCQYLDGCHPRHQTPVNVTKGPRISILTNTHHTTIHSTHAVAIIKDQRDDKNYINKPST